MTGVRRSATLLLVVGVLSLPGPVAAEERVVRIGADGVRPQLLRAVPGDTVRFVSDDPTFAYRAQSTGGPWRFDSGPTALLRGDFTVPSALTRPATYSYRVAQDAPYAGTVVVGDGGPPTPVATASADPAAVPTTATPAPVAAPAVPGQLPGQRRDRGLGLAVAVAIVLVVGAGSLLLRLLLVLPVAPAPVLSDRPARL